MSGFKPLIAEKFGWGLEVFDQLDPVKDIELDESDLDVEFNRQPKLYALYSHLYAEVTAIERETENRYNRVYATADDRVRQFLYKEGVKITEKIVENKVFDDPEYQSAFSELSEAKKQTQIVKGFMEALRHKLQALIEAGATRRKHFPSEGN